MFLARVTGKVWATQKNKALEGKRLLLVSRLEGENLTISKDTILAVCKDIDAGIGDTVLVLDEGGSARSILRDKTAPLRTIIVGVVDAINFKNSSFVQ